jgi:hypothetical protein
MAARGVSLGYLVTALCLSVGAAAATFQLKHAVRDLERSLAEVDAAIVQERWAIQSARADLAYLTRPERLVLQAEQLGMVPARGTRLVQAEQILTHQQLHFANAAMPATLPSGAEVSLRLRPSALLASLGGGD